MYNNVDLQWFGDSGETKRTTQTNMTNRMIAQENLAYQREWNDYQKSLNEQIMQREDTAIQRQVADARAAGISPLAASNVGQAQTGTSVQTGSPLDNTFRRESGSSPLLENLQALNTAVGAFSSLQSSIENIQNMSLKRDLLSAQLQGQRYSNDYRGGELYDRAYSRAYNDKYGLTTGMSEKERLIRTLAVDILGVKGSGDFVTGKLNPLDDKSSVVDFPSPTHLTSQQIKQFVEDVKKSNLQTDSLLDVATSAVDTLVNKVKDAGASTQNKVVNKDTNKNPQGKSNNQLDKERKINNARSKARKKLSGK